MVKTLTTVTVNGNEISLTEDRGYYFIHWGEQGKPKAIKKDNNSIRKKTLTKLSTQTILRSSRSNKNIKIQ